MSQRLEDIPDAEWDLLQQYWEDHHREWAGRGMTETELDAQHAWVRQQLTT